MNYQIVIDDYICSWYYSKQFLRTELSKFKGKHVDLKISSLGGDLNHAFDMYQQLKDHGDVTAYLSGFVASAATVIAMGAKEVKMSKRSSLFLVHKCSNFVNVCDYLNSDQMRAAIADLESNAAENDKIDRMLASLYSAKTGKSETDIMNLLTNADWLTPEETLSHGFVDELIDDEDPEKLDYSPAFQSKFNALGLPSPALRLNPSGEISEESIISKIISRLGALGIRSPKPENMTKHNFSSISSAVEGFSFESDSKGIGSISADSLEKLDKALKENSESLSKAEQTIKDQESKISDLEAQISALKDTPGDDSKDVNDDGSSPEPLTVTNILDSIKHC